MRRVRDEREDADLLVYEDQGSGALIRLTCFGEYAEPTVEESLREGCDLISFSGDELLGGPQAGIIVGKKELIDRLKANPLARAVRLDKMTLAALEETLRIYLEPERALAEIPTLRMLSATPEELRPRAEALAKAIVAALPVDAADIDLVDEISRAGGGALPMCDIPTFCVRMRFEAGNAQGCEEHLQRNRDVPVIGRIKRECVLFDARTITEEINKAHAIVLDKHAEPNAIGGLSNTLRYKWFDLNFMFSYQFGGYSYDNWAQKTEHGGNDLEANIPSYYKDSWKKPGDVTKYELFYEKPSVAMNKVTTTRRLHSTDFIRLKTLTFGFTVPKDWTRKIGIENVRLYASANNLWTWAAYDYYDPEAVSGGTAIWGTPPLKTVTFGINVNF